MITSKTLTTIENSRSTYDGQQTILVPIRSTTVEAVENALGHAKGPNNVVAPAPAG